jgi:palmitoyl-protein thioesterase
VVVPKTSSYFTLPTATSDPENPTPIAWADLPLYKYDYIGLRELSERGRVYLDECEGRHMAINRGCWDRVLDYLERPPALSTLGPALVNQGAVRPT